MKSMLAFNRGLCTVRGQRRITRLGALSALLFSALASGVPAAAQTALADQPLFSTTSVPGNLALVLSVEFPTAISVAHTNRSYANATTYLGFFDPNKCYDYRYTNGTSTDNYFYPSALAATGHICSGKWSGNFLNWASMQTIDPFRWVLTGGYRVIDDIALTVIEKAWGSAQGGKGNFPDSSIPSTMVAGATPFAASTGALNMRVWGLGNKMRFTNGPASTVDNAATPYNPLATWVSGTVYEVFIRAKVCDPSAAVGGIEANCKPYGANYKPEGLLQQYSNKIRYSALGYLNDSNILRDGGVLRAQQKFVGPTKPVPGSTAVANAAREWDASTGIFTINPDSADAAATALIFGPISNSGVINYLNKFGEITPGSYKTYDNVSELYYAAIRYFKALPDVPEWTAVGSAPPSTKAKWADGFPVITSPVDPILYSCQKNFILGIGDANTHADKNVPGNTLTANEPAMPALVTADTSVNAVTATNKVGVLENIGGGSLGTVSPYNGCCSNNSTLMAGLAYDSHINDIRPDIASKPNTAGKQTIDTYWVDVQEYQTYKTNNQFYLATKYGGFTVPVGYDPNNTTALTESWWHTNTDSTNGQKRPDNYFSGGQPDLAKAGLEAAFNKIAAAISAYTTSFSTSLPQVATAGNSSFASKYDAATWTGEVTASNLSFDPTTGDPSVVKVWDFTTVLATQLASGGWNSARRIASWNGTAGVPFRATTLSTDQMNQLDTAYVAGDDRLNYLNYLRGDQTNEVGSTVPTSTKAYRARTKLLGDIVGSKARPWGRPAFPYSDSTNPGYSAFKTTWNSRRTVVYVGANDGMLHAINGALVTSPTTPPAPPMESDSDAGKEMFAYVPSPLFRGPNNTPNVDGLASLGNSTFSHHHMVNATPIVYDIDFSRTYGSSGGPNWHTVLIGGMGKGGRSYYALDVTDPQGIVSGGESTLASKVMWEFSRSTLGYTYGDALVMKTKKYGWVAVFLSGYNNDDGKGYFIFVNPRTGAFLEEVSTGVGTVTNSAGLAHGEAFIVDSSDGTADAIYAGDLLGNMWRLDVTATTGNYPAPVKLAQLVSTSGGAQPVTSRPSVEIHPRTKKRFVMFGTGRLLDQVDIASTQEQTFYTISDGTNAAFNATLPSPLVFPITRANLRPNSGTTPLGSGLSFGPTDMGWYEDLGLDPGTPTSSLPVPSTGIAWRVISDSSTLAGSVAFAAILPNGDVCSPSGSSRVYGRDFAAATTTVKNPGDLTKALYISLSGSVTDLRYLSVNGKPTLISGTDTGSVGKIDINPLGSLIIRRLNWREVEAVD